MSCLPRFARLPPSRLFGGAAGDSPDFAPPPLLEKVQLSLPTSGADNLDFFSSEKTSRTRPASFTRDDSPQGWRLARRTRATMAQRSSGTSGIRPEYSARSQSFSQ